MTRGLVCCSGVAGVIYVLKVPENKYNGIAQFAEVQNASIAYQRSNFKSSI